MKTVLIKLLTTISLFALSGCAFTNDYVKFTHDPSRLNILKTGENKAVKLNKLKDARGVDPKLLSYKGGAMKTGGQYINEEDVSELVTNALRDVLLRKGYDLDEETTDFVLNGEILRFDSNVIMGFWSGSIEATIQLNLKIVNKETGLIVWTETIAGYGKKAGVQVDRWGNRELAFQKAFDSLLENIAKSESLETAISGN